MLVNLRLTVFCW